MEKKTQHTAFNNDTSQTLPINICVLQGSATASTLNIHQRLAQCSITVTYITLQMMLTYYMQVSS